MSDLAAEVVDEQFVEVLEGKVGEAIAEMLAEPHAASLPMCGFTWSDDVIKAVGHPFDPIHVCKSTVHGELRPHECGQCSATSPSPTPPTLYRDPTCGKCVSGLDPQHLPHSPTPATDPADEVREAIDDAIADIDEAMNILDRRAHSKPNATTRERIAHSKRITDRLLEGNRKVLSPTEVIPPVQRAPGLDAIATAVQRLVRRMSKEVTTSSTTVWHLELPGLKSRIATRLEEAGLSPAKALRTATAIAEDVRREADVVEEYIRTRVTEATQADVARNLLPRISKVMKETNDG